MLDMKKLVLGLIMLAITFVLISTANKPLIASDLPNADNSKPFLTYNDTTYGINMKYPSNWQIDESAHEHLLAFLQNLTSESQMTDDSLNKGIKSKVSEILDTFGLESVSGLFGLNPDKRAEFLQTMSQVLNEGSSQVIVMFRSPPEDELDTIIENLNIVAGNISGGPSISLNDYVKANIEGMKTGLQDFAIVQPPKEITIDGKPAVTLVYTVRDPVDTSITLKNLLVLAISGNTGYVLTFTSTPDTYSAYAPTFERMLHSFKTNN
jgi:hypothetical protein